MKTQTGSNSYIYYPADYAFEVIFWQKNSDIVQRNCKIKIQCMPKTFKQDRGTVNKSVNNTVFLSQNHRG